MEDKLVAADVDKLSEVVVIGKTPARLRAAMETPSHTNSWIVSEAVLLFFLAMAFF